MPPMAGLQLICAIRSRFMVTMAVRRPMRAQARAASQPAWPAPMTTTSYRSGIATIVRGMKILVIGSGGREHALCWKLAQSPGVEVFACPGNPGMARVATCVPGDPLDAALRVGADLTVVGPEVPLVAGVVDAFHSRGLRIVGPNAEAARLEGSKIFAKDFFQQRGIPTAEYVTVEDASQARMALGRFGFPVVLKADGLAAGKGTMDFGFKPDHVLNLAIDANEIGMNDAQAHDLAANILSRLHQVPGVESVSHAGTVPLGYMSNGGDTMVIDGAPAAPDPSAFGAGYNVVSPEYFTVMGIDIVRGRGLTDSDDTHGRDVAVISESTAKKYWANQDPMGGPSAWHLDK